jgi:hypothetical protein
MRQGEGRRIGRTTVMKAAVVKWDGEGNGTASRKEKEREAKVRRRGRESEAHFKEPPPQRNILRLTKVSNGAAQSALRSWPSLSYLKDSRLPLVTIVNLSLRLTKHCDLLASGCIDSYINDLDTYWEWLASRPGHIIPQERAPGTHWIWRWVGPKWRAGRKTFLLNGIRSPAL